MEKQKNQQKKKAQKKQLKIYKIKLDCKKELGLLISKEDKYTIPIFIPHKGCNNECVFCNQKKISGENRAVKVEDIENLIKKHLLYYKYKDKKVEIAFFGGSFTGLNINEQIKFLKSANKFIKSGEIDNIKISTRPDYITKEILEMLKKYNVKTIELGVQSMDNQVLELSKRGHNSEDVIKASLMIKEKGFKLGHQVMVGLPGSNIENEIATIKKCIVLKPDVVRIYPVYVLKQSELYELYLNKKYIPLDLENSILRAKAIYLECIKNNINVIRIGLQGTEEINSNNKEIIGPVCDNYKDRILSSIMYDEIVKKIDKRINLKGVFNAFKRLRLKEGDYLNILVPKSQISYAVGYLKENILKLDEKYKMKFYIKEK